MFKHTTAKQHTKPYIVIEPEMVPAWVDRSMIGNQQFWDWTRKFGFVTGPWVHEDELQIMSGPEMVTRPSLFEYYDYLQEKLIRYWLAFLANVPPESSKAKALANSATQLQIQGLGAAHA